METVRNEGAVTVYWRPGCPFCTRLLNDLDRIGLPVRMINIWEDRAAATVVRGIADGNETVPTVVVGEVTMVNPRAADVLDAARGHAPQLIHDINERAASGPWWAGLAATLFIAAIWFIAAVSDPTTTYHFAPALVADAWPAGRRLRAGRRLPILIAATAAAGSVVIAVAGRRR